MNRRSGGLENGTIIGSAAVRKNPIAAFSTSSDKTKFYHNGDGLYLGNFLFLRIQLYKQSYANIIVYY